jgi:hypothetical protein
MKGSEIGKAGWRRAQVRAQAPDAQGEGRSEVTIGPSPLLQWQV